VSIDIKPLSYRPSAFYFRKALNEAKTVSDAQVIGHQVIRELEMLKAWVREQGLIPPRQFILSAEAQEKKLGDYVEVIPFSSASLRKRKGSKAPKE
jgi:hypothetical protein